MFVVLYMRPPEQRHAHKGEQQIRPTFQAPMQLQSSTGYPKSVFYCAPNKNSPMERACQKPHQLVTLPLFSDKQYREGGLRSVPALQGGPNHPYLAPKPIPHKQHQVSTYN